MWAFENKSVEIVCEGVNQVVECWQRVSTLLSHFVGMTASIVLSTYLGSSHRREHCGGQRGSLRWKAYVSMSLAPLRLGFDDLNAFGCQNQPLHDDLQDSM